MSHKIAIKRIATYSALVLLGMLISATLLDTYASERPAAPAEAAANEPAIPSVALDANPASPDAQVWTTCTPLNVAVYSSRVHVKCVETVGGIQYFALSTANAAHVARVLSLLSTAHAAGRTLDILYDPADTSGSAIGCATNDCRLIIAAAFLQ